MVYNSWENIFLTSYNYSVSNWKILHVVQPSLNVPVGKIHRQNVPVGKVLSPTGFHDRFVKPLVKPFVPNTGWPFLDTKKEEL